MCFITRQKELVNHPNIPLWAIGVGYSEPEFLVPFTNAEREVLGRESTLIITRQKELVQRLYRELGKPSYSLPCPALFCFEKFPEKTRWTLTPQTIAHSLEEMTPSTYFDSDYNEMLNYIGSHRFITSKRLHGAIAGISSGAFVTLMNDSFRCKSAIELFDEVMQTEDKTAIYDFKKRTLNDYTTILKKHYDQTYPRR